MAQYRLSAQVISRAEGSATSFAAYRAGVALQDEATGEVHDYSRRRGVVQSEILAPAGAPGWATDRARLWNEVERAERRDDAQLAREIQLSLPSELNAEQRADLVREFVRREFVALGMVADYSIHAPTRVTHKMLEKNPDQHYVTRDDGSMDNDNHHVHILLTLRDIGPEGFGKKNRAWNDRKLLAHWREAWADAQNAALARHGHHARVDHRSHAARGIEDEPQIHLGRAATAMERRGERSDRGDINREIRARNAARRESAERIADLERQISEARAEAVQLVGGTLGAVVGAARAAAVVQPRTGVAVPALLAGQGRPEWDWAEERDEMAVNESEMMEPRRPAPEEIERGIAAARAALAPAPKPARQQDAEREEREQARRRREREAAREAEIERQREAVERQREQVARMRQRIEEAEQREGKPAPGDKLERMQRDLAQARQRIEQARGGGLLSRLVRAIFGPSEQERQAADLARRIERAIERERPQAERRREEAERQREQARDEAEALRDRLPGAERLALRAELRLAQAEALRPAPGESEQERHARLLRPWELRERLADDPAERAEAREQAEIARRLVLAGEAPTDAAVRRERAEQAAQEAAQERARAAQSHAADEGQGYSGPR